MNEIPIIRKGSFKSYWSNGFGGGLLLGILFFLFALSCNSLQKSLFIGLIVWIGIIVLFWGIGFTSEEYFKRKKNIKELFSSKYAFLDKCKFTLHEDLFFEGVYDGYFFRVLPITKWIQKGRGRGMYIQYIGIQAFYSFESDTQDCEREDKMSGKYFFGEVYFGNQCASFAPKDWESPDFEQTFDGIISIFKRENLKPISQDDWEKKVGEKLRMEREREEQERIKLLLKIRKLDI